MAKKDYIWSDFNQEKLNTFCNEAFSGNFGSITIGSLFPTQNFLRLKELLGVDDISINTTYSAGQGIPFFPSFYFYKVNDNWFWFLQVDYQGFVPQKEHEVVKKTRTAASITFTSNTSKYFRLKTQKSTGEYTQDTIDKVTSITFTIDCTESSTDWCNFNSSTGTITYNYKGDYCRFKEFNHSTDLQIWNAYLWNNGQQLFNQTYFESTNTKVSASQPTIPDRYNYNSHTNLYQATLPTFGYYGFGGHLYKFLSYPYVGIGSATTGHYIFKNAQAYGADISGKDFEHWAIKPAPKFQYIGTKSINWITNLSFESDGHYYFLKPGQKVFEFVRTGNNEMPRIEEQSSAYDAAYGGPAFTVNHDNANGASVFGNFGPRVYLNKDQLPHLDWRYSVKTTPIWNYRELYNGGAYSWVDITDTPDWLSSLFETKTLNKYYSISRLWMQGKSEQKTNSEHYSAALYITPNTDLTVRLNIWGDIKILKDDTSDYDSLINFSSITPSCIATDYFLCAKLLVSYNISIGGLLNAKTFQGIGLIGQNEHDWSYGCRTYGNTSTGYQLYNQYTYTNAYPPVSTYGYADFRMYCMTPRVTSSSFYYIYDENGVDNYADD